MDWSSLVANGIVGSLLGLYLGSIRRRIDDGTKRLDEIGRRIDAVQTEVTSQGKALARIEGRLDPYDLEKNRSE